MKHGLKVVFSNEIKKFDVSLAIAEVEVPFSGSGWTYYVVTTEFMQLGCSILGFS